MSSAATTTEDSALAFEQLPAARSDRHGPLVLGSLTFLSAVLICAVAGPYLAPDDPAHQDLAKTLQEPSWAHLLGTDDLGRDVLSRCIVGARTAVLGAFLIMAGVVVVGNFLGVMAGYRGGWLDAIVMRWTEMMYALPALLVAIVIGGVLGGGFFVAVAILIVLSAPYHLRIVRSAVLEQTSQAYVDAARALGVGDRTIMRRHIWPNTLPIVVAHAFLVFAIALVTLASLSFVGIGAAPGTPDWGRMLAESRTLLFANAATAIAPALLLVLTAATSNVVGDWAHERLTDRLRSA